MICTNTSSRSCFPFFWVLHPEAECYRRILSGLSGITFCLLGDAVWPPYRQFGEGEVKRRDLLGSRCWPVAVGERLKLGLTGRSGGEGKAAHDDARAPGLYSEVSWGNAEVIGSTGRGELMDDLSLRGILSQRVVLDSGSELGKKVWDGDQDWP